MHMQSWQLAVVNKFPRKYKNLIDRAPDVQHKVASCVPHGFRCLCLASHSFTALHSVAPFLAAHAINEAMAATRVRVPVPTPAPPNASSVATSSGRSTGMPS
eukprot:TRINITY_DN915_c0_g1_i12.p2 TRINITY_DN915_c0_g1~~TRINITY_DN915_c0_g1_i12.p2  ORF type:complete len:102 (+),score=4.65 TRINITY_DN915_c0_g1_i12:484-789(+)